MILRIKWKLRQVCWPPSAQEYQGIGLCIWVSQHVCSHLAERVLSLCDLSISPQLDSWSILTGEETGFRWWNHGHNWAQASEVWANWVVLSSRSIQLISFVVSLIDHENGIILGEVSVVYLCAWLPVLWLTVPCVCVYAYVYVCVGGCVCVCVECVSDMLCVSALCSKRTVLCVCTCVSTLLLISR